MGSNKTLVVRNLMKLLRVNLETGDVKPIRMNINGIRKHRSPDSKSVAFSRNGDLWTMKGNGAGAHRIADVPSSTAGIATCWSMSIRTRISPST